MALLYQFLVVAHFLGLAALIGGWVATRSGAATITPVVWGARAQLLTGLLLVGLAEMTTDADLNHAKIGVKLAIALAAVVAAEIASARTRRGSAQPQLLDAAGALAVVNVLVAVLWV